MTAIRSILIGVGACSTFACGAAPQADTPEDAAAPFVSFDPAFNVCPTFSGALVIPLDIAPNARAHIILKASDPDGLDSTLSYEWRAPTGSFSDAESAVTEYYCGALGPQALEATARDVRGCSRSLELDVTCIPQ